MPRPALTPEQRRETRRKIRQAAADLYAETGLGDISVRAIAKRAEVSVGTIYSYYDNLPALMQSLWKQPVIRLVAHLEDLAAATSDPVERLRKLLQAYVAFAREQRSVYRGAFLFVRPDAADKPVPTTIEQSGIADELVKAVADGQAAGVFRQGRTVSLVQTIWAGVHGAIALPINIDRLAFDDPEQIPDDMIEALLEWLQAEPATPPAG